MQTYKDINGDSGVAAFEIGTNSITIAFKTGGTYLYNDFRPGASDVEMMKRLALSGDGLATYINQNVRKNYATKVR